MVKKAGDWTGSLYEMAKRADYGEANGLSREVKVLVEGPYGELKTDYRSPTAIF